MKITLKFSRIRKQKNTLSSNTQGKNYMKINV